MALRLVDETPSSLELETPRLAARLIRIDRWRAELSLWSTAPESTEDDRFFVTLYGECEPFSIARDSFVAAAAKGSQVDGADAKALAYGVTDIARASKRLRAGFVFDERMHHGQICSFLDEVIKEQPSPPQELIDRARGYAESWNRYEQQKAEPFWWVGEVDYTGDWVYQMALDLVRRQLPPGEALCVIVVFEPLDVAFNRDFLNLRKTLDSLSGDYVHFFALSATSYQVSRNGKRELIAALRGRNILVSGDEPFLVFIQIRVGTEEGTYEADVMGVQRLPGNIAQGAVLELMTKIAETARTAKLEGKSFDDFVKAACASIQWVRIRQQLAALIPLVELLEKAMKFLRPS